MKDLSTILATNSNGKDISLGEVNQWLNANNKRELAQFIYDRLYGRYIRPFDYPSDDYRLKYKNGFTIMTNCCLLIETYTSWSEPFFRSTDKKSERCFMYFFKSHDSFKDFATGSPSIKAITDLSQSVNHNGVACDFYHNVRCGLLHSAETKNGWKLHRNGPLYDGRTKRINAVMFMNRLKSVIKQFKKSLDDGDINSDQNWITYKNRLTDLVKST